MSYKSKVTDEGIVPPIQNEESMGKRRKNSPYEFSPERQSLMKQLEMHDSMEMHRQLNARRIVVENINQVVQKNKIRLQDQENNLCEDFKSMESQLQCFSKQDQQRQKFLEKIAQLNNSILKNVEKGNFKKNFSVQQRFKNLEFENQLKRDIKVVRAQQILNDEKKERQRRQ